ncbi:hypothetical protein KAR91_49080 [Candidatus Pacearchaeota archaeon]|nr:hypothetical protein [Candidatus Pacearchaeota archaeon]
MTVKKILDHHRIRSTHNRFGFVPHRFLRDGFLSSLERDEALLYLFYVLAADRFGLSYYGDRRICKDIGFSAAELCRVRDGLTYKNLICRDDPLCQLLELPDKPVTEDLRQSGINSFSDLNQSLQR